MSRLPKTLLLVDDEPDFLAALSAFLTAKGYRVLTAGSGEEALGLARLHQPDLYVLDVAMPGMDGYALCAALKEADETFAAPVIFLSGQGQAGDMLRGYYAGAHEYLTKPLDRAALLQQLGRLIRA